MVGATGWFWILILLIFVISFGFNWIVEEHPEFFQYLHII